MLLFLSFPLDAMLLLRVEGKDASCFTNKITSLLYCASLSEGAADVSAKSCFRRLKCRNKELM